MTQHRALRLNAYGPAADSVDLHRVETAPPGPGEVAVALEFAPVNPSDLLLVNGIYGVRPALPSAIGTEGSGRIVEVGPGVDRSRVGDRVLIVPGRGHWTWQERVTVAADDVVTVRADSAQASMLGINGATAWALLADYADLKPGDWIAQTGATSATAGYLRAIARSKGLRVLDVVRRQESVDVLRATGAHEVLAEGDDLATQVGEVLGGEQIQLVLDAVGVQPREALSGHVVDGGGIVTYASRGFQPVVTGIKDFVFRDVRVHGFWVNRWLRTASAAEVAAAYRAVDDLVVDGTLSAPIDAVYPLEDWAAAFEHAARPDRTGKVLFTIG